MTLKEELEILRGEPIKVFDGDPMDIPCIETSDSERLCKHPVVSVQMITYNHEPYIRQAIEGVIMQQTDFEFELVIGEDCSTDKTREICFEYQKKYPDKIRVLWWHENVSKLGGNGRRTRAHCRGEFVALCEGDDYWVDPKKIQKQVDVFRRNPTVGYCVTGAYVQCDLDKTHPRLRNFRICDWIDDNKFKFNMGAYRPGLVHSLQFWENRHDFPRTATVMYRKKCHKHLIEKYEIFKWRLELGDALLWMGFPGVCDAYYLEDITAVYRLNANGVSVVNCITADHIIMNLIEYFYSCKRNESKVTTDRIIFEIINKRIRSWELNSEKDIQELKKIKSILEIHRFDCLENFYIKIYFFLRGNVRFNVVKKTFERIIHPVRSFNNIVKRFF